jgi:hypothetical protein
MARHHLIRLFIPNLPLYRDQQQTDNGCNSRAYRTGTARPFASTCNSRKEGTMNKLALFLFGFLVLTIGIGLLATIPPA